MLLDDHVAEIDPDAEPDPPLLRHLGLALGHAALDLHSAAHRIDHAWKFREHAVAGVLHHPAPMLGDLRLDQLTEMPLEPFVRALLIRPHQTRVPRHVGGEDRGKAAGGGHC